MKLETKDGVPASGSSTEEKKEIGGGDAASGKPPDGTGKTPDSTEGASGEDDEKSKFWTFDLVTEN